MSITRLKFRLLGPALAGGCLVLAVAVACGGGETKPPSSTASPSPASTADALPTVNPDVPLVEYRSPDIGYSISYPEGWDVHGSSGSSLVAFSWSLNGRPIAQLTVLCNRGQNQTVESLMGKDAAILAQNGGVMPQESTPIELAGAPGKQVTYTTVFAATTVEQVAAYAVAGDCGWRIGLATYAGEGSLQPYLPLFQRIIASLRQD